MQNLADNTRKGPKRVHSGIKKHLYGNDSPSMSKQGENSPEASLFSDVKPDKTPEGKMKNKWKLCHRQQMYTQQELFSYRDTLVKKCNEIIEQTQWPYKAATAHKIFNDLVQFHEYTSDMHHKYGISDSMPQIEQFSIGKPTQESSHVTLPLVEPQFPTDGAAHTNILASKKYSLPEPRFKKISGKVTRGAPSPQMSKPYLKPRDPSVPKFASSSKMIINSSS